MAFDIETCLYSVKHGGTTARVNHSRSPNFHMEAWEVQGCLFVGIFSQCDVQQGEELTIDYE